MERGVLHKKKDIGESRAARVGILLDIRGNLLFKTKGKGGVQTKRESARRERVNQDRGASWEGQMK